MVVDKGLVFSVEKLVAGCIVQERNTDNKEFNEKYPTLLDVLQSHAELPINEALEMMQRVANHFTFVVLCGNIITDFNKKLNSLISAPGVNVTLNHSVALKFLMKVDKNQRTSEEISVLGYNSKPIGKEGNKLILELRILRCVHVQSSQYDFYAALGITKDGNLFSFSPKAEINLTADYNYKMSCKVKSHYEDKYVNMYEVTRVNYCKELLTN